MISVQTRKFMWFPGISDKTNQTEKRDRLGRTIQFAFNRFIKGRGKKEIIFPPFCCCLVHSAQFQLNSLLFLTSFFSFAQFQLSYMNVHIYAGILLILKLLSFSPLSATLSFPNTDPYLSINRVSEEKKLSTSVLSITPSD
jgi:hypothetical protein